jgi:hypothetical protein
LVDPCVFFDPDALDLREHGHGEPEALASDYHYQEFSEDFDLLVDLDSDLLVDLDSAMCCGNSDGSQSTFLAKKLISEPTPITALSANDLLDDVASFCQILAQTEALSTGKFCQPLLASTRVHY